MLCVFQEWQLLCKLRAHFVLFLSQVLLIISKNPNTNGCLSCQYSISISVTFVAVIFTVILQTGETVDYVMSCSTVRLKLNSHLGTLPC